MRQERTSGITHIQQPFFHQDLISELALKAVVLPVEMRGFRITHAPVFSHNPADPPGINAAVQAVGDFFGGNRTNPEFFGVFPSRFSSAFHELPAVYLHIKIISLWTGRVKVKFTFLIYAMHFFRMARPIGGIGRVLIRSSKGVMLHPEEIDGPLSVAAHVFSLSPGCHAAPSDADYYGVFRADLRTVAAIDAVGRPMRQAFAIRHCKTL